MTIPDFVKDNPWVPELKQRGKEPPDTYLPSDSKQPITAPKEPATASKKHKSTPKPHTKRMRIPPLNTLESIGKYNRSLIRKLLTQEIDSRELSSLNGLIRNQINVVNPLKPVVVTQQVAVTPNSEQFLSRLNENEQAVLARAIAKLEATPSPS
jgi:hypothetical protein